MKQTFKMFQKGQYHLSFLFKEFEVENDWKLTTGFGSMEVKTSTRVILVELWKEPLLQWCAFYAVLMDSSAITKLIAITTSFYFGLSYCTSSCDNPFYVFNPTDFCNTVFHSPISLSTYLMSFILHGLPNWSYPFPQFKLPST